MPKFENKSTLFGYFWVTVSKNYCHISNQHPQICQKWVFNSCKEFRYRNLRSVSSEGTGPVLIKYAFWSQFFSSEINTCNKRNQESVIVSAFIPVYNLENQGGIKTVSVLTRLPCSLVTWCGLNWLNG